MQPKENIGPVDRWIRLVVGYAAAIVGLVSLVSGPASVPVGAAEAALFALGVDLFVTGLRCHSPLYRFLDLSTAPRHEDAAMRTPPKSGPSPRSYRSCCQIPLSWKREKR